jgi:hypothetical protein
MTWFQTPDRELRGGKRERYRTEREGGGGEWEKEWGRGEEAVEICMECQREKR